LTKIDQSDCTMFVAAFLFSFQYPFTNMQNLTSSGRACDHMIYDGACECYERRDPSFDFYAELTEIHQDDEGDDPEVAEYLDYARLLDEVEYQRLLDYLIDEPPNSVDSDIDDNDYEPYETGHLSPIQADECNQLPEEEYYSGAVYN